MQGNDFEQLASQPTPTNTNSSLPTPAGNDFDQLAKEQTPPTTSTAPPPVPPKSMAQHAMDTIHTALSDVGIPNTAEQVTAANKLLGEQMRHPFRTAKEVGGATVTGALSPNDTEALQKAKDEYKNGNYVESARHFMNYLVPFVGGSADKAGDAVDSKEWGKAMGHIIPAVLPFIFGGGEAAPITSPEEAAANAAKQFKETPAQTGTSEGPRTLLRPTTRTTAGVEAPIAASQQENAPLIAKGAEKAAGPYAKATFQAKHVAPAAERQLVSTVGQVAEDKIASHNAIIKGEPIPEQLAGTQTASKFDTFDKVAQGARQAAEQTYQHADQISEREHQDWQQKATAAIQAQKELVERHNANIDEYNAGLSKDEEPMARVTFNPNDVNLPEKPMGYNELKRDLDVARLNSSSPDAVVRDEAFKNGIPKAQKALDGWFKSHSDEISPAEYDSARKLRADAERFQDVADGLRGAQKKGNLTQNALRGIEARIDQKYINRGMGENGFGKLLGQDGYDNWRQVSKLFDKENKVGLTNWGAWMAEYVASTLMGVHGLVGKAATEFVLNHVLFNPEMGQWFSKATNFMKYMATSEKGELGLPGALQDEFHQIMNRAQGKAAEEVRAQATPSLIDQVENEDENRPIIRGRGTAGFDVEHPNGKLQIDTHGDRATVKAVDVDENHQRQGIASKLYQEAAQELRNRGIKTLVGSLEGSGPVQLREKTFGPGNTKYFHGGDQVSTEQAVKIMDKDFGYVRAETNLSPSPVRDVASRQPHEPAKVSTAEVSHNLINNAEGKPDRIEIMRGDEPVGHVKFEEEIPGTWTVKDAVVKEGEQGKGYGTGAYKQLFDEARKAGIKTVESDVSSSSKAIGLWQALQREFPEAVKEDNGQYSADVSKISPTAEALPEARPAAQLSDEYKTAMRDKEIATTQPSAVNADRTNNPENTSGIKTLDKAAANGSKIKTTVAQAIAGYKDTGLKLSPEELENPAENANSIIKKAVSHYKDNLVALYNSIPESIRGISKQWYESAHDLSKDFAKKYGVKHEQAAAVIAALSPNNPWDNNVGMADRLMDRWANDRGRIWDEKMDEKLSSIRNAKSTKPEFRSYLDSIRGKNYDELQGETNAETRAMQGLWLRMADQAYGSPEVPVYAPDGTIRGSQKIAWGPYDAVAKAVELLENGDIQNIHNLMGNGHKIRNFYNNIINPWSDRGHVTIDTHAVGAAHWKPFSQKDVEVGHNFGGSVPGVPGAGKHADTGIAGTYPIYDEAYKQAAKEVGVSPRELQSITWEGIRSLFSGAKKTPELRKAVGEIWAKESEGKITADQARQQIVEKAGGFKRPVWTTEGQWSAAQK